MLVNFLFPKTLVLSKGTEGNILVLVVQFQDNMKCANAKRLIDAKFKFARPRLIKKIQLGRS